MPMPEGRRIPGLAAEWEASEAGLTWRLTLREGVIFHDGRPMDADADAEAVMNALFIACGKPGQRMPPGSRTGLTYAAIAALMSILACSGVRSPMLGCRRRRLQKMAMHPKSAAFASWRDRNLVRWTSSSFKEAKRFSIGALPRQSPFLPNEAWAFQSSRRCLWSPAAYWTP